MGKITEEQYDNHDCHRYPMNEDGCVVCERWAKQHEDE